MWVNLNRIVSLSNDSQITQNKSKKDYTVTLSSVFGFRSPEQECIEDISSAVNNLSHRLSWLKQTIFLKVLFIFSLLMGGGVPSPQLHNQQ
jgi:hypothetical protein